MKKLCILIIDDNPDDRTLTIRELNKEFKFSAIEIKNTKELKKALDESKFDLVITDYQLRWSNGLEILKEVKKRFPNCPVIMFTGTGNEELAIAAMKAGLDDYVVKSPKHFIRIPAAVRSVIEHSQERELRHLAENAKFESEEKFHKIFESSPNAITVSNFNGKIIECNQATLDLYGYSSKEEIIGKNAFEFIEKKDHERAGENMKKIMKDGLVKNIEYTFIKRDGRKFPVEFSAGAIIGLSGKPVSYVTLTKDITEQKRAEEEMKKRMLSFKLEDSNLYLASEAIPSVSIKAFLDLLKIGYFGLVISRMPETDFKRILVGDNFEFIWLAEVDNENTMSPKLDEIENKIEDLPRKNVILLDRIDYLIFKNGFKKTLSFVQHLREIAYLKNNIIIISADPLTLNEHELRLFEKECKKIEPVLGKKELPAELFKILKYIYSQNMLGIKPSYINVGSDLDISKPTVRKRIKYLLKNGYLNETLKGRKKTLDLTETGRNLFFK